MSISGYDEERVADTKRFLRRLWAGESVGRPGYQLSVPGPELPQDGHEDLLAALLAANQAHSQVEDDSVPTLWPHYAGVAVFATAFGAQAVQTEQGGGTVWARPIVTTDQPEQAARISRPGTTDGALGKVLDFVNLAEAETQGHYTFRICDMQGPLDIAAQLWDQTYMLPALRSHPHVVHRLLDHITTLMIEFVRDFRAACSHFTGMHCPHVWMPPECGVGLSEDLAPLLSPRDYAEFSLPYVQRIADDLGGVHLHCCGTCEHQFDNWASLRGLNGLNLHPPHIDFARAAQAFGDRVVFCQGVAFDADDGDQRDVPATLDYYLSRANSDTRFFFCLPGDGGDGRTARLVERVHGWNRVAV